MWCENRPTSSSALCSFWTLSTFPLASPAADPCVPRCCMDWLPPIIRAAARHYLEQVAEYPKILTGRKQKASCLGWQEKDDQVSGAAASKWKTCPWRITWSLFEQNVGLARTGSARLSLHQRKVLMTKANVWPVTASLYTVTLKFTVLWNVIITSK